MNIAATQYNLPHKALEIYLSGCNGPHCPGCHNTELWNFDVGEDINKALERLLIKLERDGDMIQEVWVLGGEPLDQELTQLLVLLSNIPKHFRIVLFTRYELSDVPYSVLVYADLIKTGAYVSELACTDRVFAGITLASTNQEVKVRGVDFCE